MNRLQHVGEDEPRSMSAQDQSNRYSADAMLRANGFKIVSRHRNEEPLWGRGKLVVPQSRALAIVAGEEKWLQIQMQANEENEHFAQFID